MLTLYHGWDSTCSIKVRFALAEKGVDYNSAVVDLLRFEQLRPDYLKLNPNGVAPTLVHDGRPIIESTVINEYLEEVFPGPRLLPEDPVRRAEARILVRLEDGRMEDAIKEPTFHLMIKQAFADMPDDELERLADKHPQKRLGEYWKRTMRSPVDREAVDRAFDTLRSIMQRLDKTLSDGRPWLVGDEVTLADCAFVPLVDRIEALGRADMFDDLPGLDAWRGRLKERPAYGKSIPPDEQRLPSPAA